MNPAGRAIFKAADYLPGLDMPDENFIATLHWSTSLPLPHEDKDRKIEALEQASPAPQMEISAEDAAAANVKDGENVVVRSRRGMVEMPVTIGKIAKGQVSYLSTTVIGMRQMIEQEPQMS
jgi:predicted molibdopterin-dependent oxidoreductase YjgC